MEQGLLVLLGNACPSPSTISLECLIDDRHLLQKDVPFSMRWLHEGQLLEVPLHVCQLRNLLQKRLAQVCAELLETEG